MQHDLGVDVDELEEYMEEMLREEKARDDAADIEADRWAETTNLETTAKEDAAMATAAELWADAKRAADAALDADRAAADRAIASAKRLLAKDNAALRIAQGERKLAKQERASVRGVEAATAVDDFQKFWDANRKGGDAGDAGETEGDWAARTAARGDIVSLEAPVRGPTLEIREKEDAVDLSASYAEAARRNRIHASMLIKRPTQAFQRRKKISGNGARIAEIRRPARRYAEDFMEWWRSNRADATGKKGKLGPAARARAELKERESASGALKTRGDDAYRTGAFEKAVVEYTRCIAMCAQPDGSWSRAGTDPAGVGTFGRRRDAIGATPPRRRRDAAALPSRRDAAASPPRPTFKRTARRVSRAAKPIGDGLPAQATSRSKYEITARRPTSSWGTTRPSPRTARTSYGSGRRTSRRYYDEPKRWKRARTTKARWRTWTWS